MGNKFFDHNSTSKSRSSSKGSEVPKTPQERLENSLKMAEERQAKLTEKISNNDKLLKSNDIAIRASAKGEDNNLRAMLAQTAAMIKDTKLDLEKLKKSAPKESSPAKPTGPR